MSPEEEGRVKVHLDCRNASNPFHKCSDYCYRIISETKKQLNSVENVVDINATMAQAAEKTRQREAMKIRVADRQAKKATKQNLSPATKKTVVESTYVHVNSPSHMTGTAEMASSFASTTDKTVSKPLERMPSWRSVYPNKTQDLVDKQLVHDPTKYVPDWSLKINDQCFDPVIARRLNEGSILPRDAEQFGQASLLRMIDYIHVNEAEGRTMKMMALEKVQEVVARLERADNEKAKLQDSLAQRDGQLMKMTYQRDNYKKRIVETTQNAKALLDEMAAYLEDLEESNRQAELQAKEAQKAKERADTAELELAKLRADCQQLKDQAVRDYKKSDQFKSDLVMLSVPANACGYLFGVEDAKKIWPEVDPKHPELKCSEVLVDDFDQMLSYYSEGNLMAQYDEYQDRLEVIFEDENEAEENSDSEAENADDLLIKFI